VELLGGGNTGGIDQNEFLAQSWGYFMLGLWDQCFHVLPAGLEHVGTTKLIRMEYLRRSHVSTPLVQSYHISREPFGPIS